MGVRLIEVSLYFWLVVPRGSFVSANQKHYPDLGSGIVIRKSSVWSFRSLFSDVISRGKPEVASNLGCLFNCHRKILNCFVTLLTLKISTRAIVMRCFLVIFRNMLWICSLQTYRDFCNVIPFCSSQTFKRVFVSGESDEWGGRRPF